jgi:hypothetical protein
MADTSWNTVYSEDLYYTYKFRDPYTFFYWDKCKFGSADLYVLYLSFKI